MNDLRKYFSSLISAILMAVFLTVLGMETSHHHGDLEENDNCAMCAWVMTGSLAVTAPAAPVLIPVILVSMLFFLSFFIPFLPACPIPRQVPPSFPPLIQRSTAFLKAEI